MPRQMRAISAATSCAETGLNSTVQVDLCTIVSDKIYVGRFGSMKMNILVGSMLLSASLCGQSFGGDLLHRLLGGRGCGASSSCCDTSVSDPSCGAEIAAPCGSGCGAGPSCGAEIAAPCGSGCGAAPSCGAEIASCDPCSAAPSCGVETSCCGPRRPILSALKAKLAGLKSKLACHAPSCGVEACDPCGSAPTCGVETAPCAAAPSCAPTCGAEISACDPCAAPSCDSGCGLKIGKRGLLAKIFKCKSSCDAAPSCDSCASAPVSGCSSCGGTPVAAPAAAPVAAPAAAPVAAPAPVVDPHAYMNTKRHVIQASSTRIR